MNNIQEQEADAFNGPKKKKNHNLESYVQATTTRIVRTIKRRKSDIDNTVSRKKFHEEVKDVNTEREKEEEPIQIEQVEVPVNRNVQSVQELCVLKTNLSQANADKRFSQVIRLPKTSTMDFQKFLQERDEEEMQRAINQGESSSSSSLVRVPKKVWMAPAEACFEFISSRVPYFEGSLPIQLRNIKVEVLPEEPHNCPAKHAYAMCRPAFGFYKSCVTLSSCKSLHWFGWMMMQYLTPDEYKDTLEDPAGTIPINHGFCYLCWCYYVNHSVFVNINDAHACTQIRLPFYHITDEIGEYKKSAMIQPISACCDSDASARLQDLSSTGAGNTYGLTRPFRMICEHDFICTTEVVDEPRISASGKIEYHKKEIPRLKEVDSLFFVKPKTTKQQLTMLAPLSYIKYTILEYPTTEDILSFYFSPTNKETGTGCNRLRSVGRRKSITHKYKDRVLLPVYWGYDMIKRFVRDGSFKPPPGYAPFPFALIFCRDLRQTEKNLNMIVEAGRIDLLLLFDHRSLVDIYVDVTSPASYFSECLIDQYTNYRYYFSVLVRVAVLEALMIRYPKNMNRHKDECIHKRLELLWESHKDIVKEIGDLDYVPTNDYFTEDKLLKFANRDIGIHMFAGDYKSEFLKYETSVCIGITPSAYLMREYNGEGKKEFFGDFQSLRWQIQLLDDSILRVLWDECYPFPYFTCGYQAIDQVITYIHNDKRGLYRHSIVVTMLLRIHTAYTTIEDEIGILKKRDRSLYVLNERILRVYKNAVVQPHEDVHERLESLITQYRKCEKIMKESEEKVYQLRLFIYTHLELAQRFLDLVHDEMVQDPTISFDDMLLKRVKRPFPNYTLSHYMETMPWDTSTPHEGMLPKLAGILPSIPFIHATDTDTHSTFAILRKLRPRVCQKRKAAAKQYETSEKNRSWLMFTVQCLELTLLGAYKHVRKAPTFVKALSVYKKLGTHFDEDDFLAWHDSHKYIILTAMKEMLIFQTMTYPPYRDYIIQMYGEYVQVEKQTYKIADMIRSRFCTTSLDNIEKTLTSIMKTTREDSKTKKRRTGDKDDEDVQKFRSEGPRTFRGKFKDFIRCMCYHIKQLNKESERRLNRVSLPSLLQKSILAFVWSLEPNTTIELSWLYLFNFGKTEPEEDLWITKQTIAYLLMAINLIDKDMHESEIHKVLRLIPAKHWEILDLFFNALASHNSINMIPIDDGAYHNHIKALRKRYQLEKGESMTKQMTCVLYSYCCNQLKSYVAQGSSPKFYGHDDTSLNIRSGAVTCNCKSNQNAARKHRRTSKVIYDKLTTSMETKNSDMLKIVCKKIRDRPPKRERGKNYRYQPECGKTPLAQIPLPGYVMQITEMCIKDKSGTQPITDAFTICDKCGSVSLFSTRMYGPNGFSCTSCDIDHAIQMQTPICKVCKNILNPKEEWNRFIVVDDDDSTGDYLVKPMFICKRCYSCKGAVYKQHGDNIFTSTELKACKIVKRDMRDRLDLRDGSRILGF